MAKILSDGRISVEAGDTLSGIYGADWKKLSGYTGDPTKLQIGTVLPSKTPVAPPSGASATPASSGLLPNTSLGQYMTPEEQQAKLIAEQAILGSGNATRDASGNLILGTAPDEATNRARVLAEFQKQIDALETAKAEQRAKLTTQYTDIGNRRLGQVGAIQARRGLLGSDFGVQATGEQTTANTNELNSVVDESNAKYDAAIQSLYSTINVEADKSFSEKRAAYSGTADQLVNYLNTKATSKSNSVNNVVKQAITLGIDLTADNASDVLAKAVSDIGVSKENILSAYKEAAKTKAAADLKAKQEADKATIDLLKTQGEIDKTYSGIDVDKAQIAKLKSETSKLYADAAAVGTVKSGNLKIATSDIAALQNYFNQSRGSDSYTNTGDYLKSMNDWINSQGQQADFFKYYPPKLYLNPGDSSLPQYLRDALKTPDILSQLGISGPASNNPAGQ
jgi:hypothetical protein